ncbi:MAG: aminotransferase class I/II-fold pyridoxal phosphate-dependent enzyme [Patescibacteria group bacterium]|nr:aminotransferase class I/II-fold pyridoxal phosphate-dependent enzyme [Patescibacteria group bacterium]
MQKRKSFTPGKDWIWYAPNTTDAYDKTEIDAVRKCLEEGWLTTGPRTKALEEKVAQLYGRKEGLFVNSGSSANLLALEIFDFPPGSEIITPACNFNTTVAPIVQKGLVPVFVDVKPGFYTLDATQLEQALSKKTVAIFAPHLIGNLLDLPKIRNFAKKHTLVFIEDSCDTIGSTFADRGTGGWSDVTTTSFYASHIITAGGAGGMLMLNDKKLREQARIFRDWGRGISRHDEKIRSRLATFTIDGEPYDSAFVFVECGYNMRPTEMQAAFGLSQLRNLTSFTAARARNFKQLYAFCAQHQDHFVLPQTEPKAKVNWLAFPLTIQKGSPLERNALARYLEDHHIQTRPLFSGNITHHPAYKGVGRIIGTLPHSNHVLKNSMLIGIHHGLGRAQTDYIAETIESYLKKHA